MVHHQRRLSIMLCTVMFGLTSACALPAMPAVSPPAATGTTPDGRSPVAAGPPAKIVLAQTAPSPSGWPMYVAIARGFYTEEGVELEKLDLPSSTTQTQALLAGDIHINSYTVDSVARAVLGGAPLKLVASAQEIPDLQLIVSADINTATDLRGRTLGVGSPGGYFDTALKAMLQIQGVEPSEYQILAVRDVRARIPALQSGQIAATLMSSPDDLIALKEGLRSLGFLYQVIPGLQYNGYAVADQWAKANETTLVHFLRGTLKGLAWLRDPANKGEAQRIFLQAAGMPVDATEIANLLYDRMVVQQMLGTDMRPNLSGTEKMLTLAVQLGSFPSVPPLDTWIDLHYLDQASRLQ